MSARLLKERTGASRRSALTISASPRAMK